MPARSRIRSTTRPVSERLNLPARHREQLEALLREHLPDVEVWAYGSRVDGRSHDGCDLDLVLRGAGLEEIDLMRLRDLQQALHDSTIPFLVEARDWARLPERFHREIEGEYVVFREGSDRLQDVRVPRQRDRDTGVPARWGDCTWGELATLEYGKALRGYREGTGPYRVFGTNGPIGRHEKALHQGPGVIVGRKGAYRGVHYSSDPFFVIDTAFYLKPTTAELDMRWAYYQLLSQDINGMDSGSAIPSTTRASFYALPLRLPPVREQRAIACTLGTLDDKIELNRRMSETLDAMVRSVFSSWFVDFDPVRAKMEGRDTGLPRQVADLFPDRLVDSELGPIPEGWRAGTLADVAHLNPESWGRKNTPGGVRYVDLANTKWGFIESVKPYAWGLAPSRARRVLRPGDTIVGTVRPGNGSFALVDRDGLTGSTGFAVLRPKATIEREIVYCAATSHGNIDRLARLADGGAYPAVNPTTVLDTAVVLPETRTRVTFSELTAPLLNQLQKNRREARILAAVRDVLLPKLVSGEIRLCELVVEEVRM